MHSKDSLVLQDPSFQCHYLRAGNYIIEMNHFLSYDKYQVLTLAESYYTALELWFEHAHRRRHQAL